MYDCQPRNKGGWEMKLTKDEPKSIEIENGIVKITFVNNNPYSNKIDENPIIRTIEFQSDTLQIMKEDAEKWIKKIVLVLQKQ